MTEQEGGFQGLAWWLILSCFLILLVIEVWSVAVRISYLFPPSVPYQGLNRWILDLETNIFYFPAGLAPFLLVGVLFSWVILPFKRYWTKMRVRVGIGSKVITLGGNEKAGGLQKGSGSFGLNLSVLMVICSLILVCFLAVYPYFPSVNPEGDYVGIDVPAYESMMGEMEENDGWNLIPYTFSRFRDRPLGLLLMFAVQKVAGVSSMMVLKFTPLLLGSALVLSMAYFMGEVTQDRTVASLTALIAAFSYPVTLGMLGGLFSNWMTLIWVYLFSALMMKSMREKKWKWVVLSASTLLLALFTHLYTWAMLMGVLGVYFLFMVVVWWRGKDVKWPLKTVGAIMVGNVAVDFIRNGLTGSVEVAGEAISVAESGLSLEFLPMFWSNIQWTLHMSMHKFYLNALILSFALIGAFMVCFTDRSVHRYLVSWLILSSVFSLLSQSQSQWRILYNLPLPILATFGFNYLRKRLHFLKNHKGNLLPFLFILFVVLINVNYGFRCAHYLLEFFVFN